ncbi:MAG: T9SS type A sorting domain-containing protein, partial [Bacteroidales bacterium]|nr:T9SS type A sorting domain-containing protein [Bacteroidales bacterium]
RSNDLTNEEVNINVLVTVLVGINELGEKTYVVSYPNPATSMINLRGNATIQQVTVSNNIGQVVYNNTFNSKEASISTTGFDAGVYFVKIETANGVTTHKVMVQ